MVVKSWIEGLIIHVPTGHYPFLHGSCDLGVAGLDHNHVTLIMWPSSSLESQTDRERSTTQPTIARTYNGHDDQPYLGMLL